MAVEAELLIVQVVRHWQAGLAAVDVEHHLTLLAQMEILQPHLQVKEITEELELQLIVLEEVDLPKTGLMLPALQAHPVVVVMAQLLQLQEFQRLMLAAGEDLELVQIIQTED